MRVPGNSSLTFPSSFVNAYTGNRKCRSALRCDFFPLAARDLRASRPHVRLGSETKRKRGRRSGGFTSRGSRKVARMHRARRGSSCRPALRRSRPYRDACRWRSNICPPRRYTQSSSRCSTGSRLSSLFVFSSSRVRPLEKRKTSCGRQTIDRIVGFA